MIPTDTIIMALLLVWYGFNLIALNFAYAIIDRERVKDKIYPINV